jgi:hypothetical protein
VKNTRAKIKIKQSGVIRIKRYISLVYGVKVHTSETKESPAKIFVGGRKSLA